MRVPPRSSRYLRSAESGAMDNGKEKEKGKDKKKEKYKDKDEYNRYNQSVTSDLQNLEAKDL